MTPRIAPAALAALVGCGFTPGKVPADDARIADMAMDDASPDAIPDASMCVAASAECVGDTLRTCSGPGAAVMQDDCGWGCDSAGGRCKEIDPAANAVMTADLVPETGLANLTLGDGINIDTGSGEIGTIADSDSVRIAGQGLFSGIRFTVVNGVGIVHVNSLHVTANVNNPIRFQFSNPIAIVADGPIEIDGVIMVRSLCTSAGGNAGGYAGGTARGPGAGPGGGDGAGAGVDKFGGGGGGNGGTGGGGGSLTAGVYVMGGVSYNDDEISMLLGGSGGGGGGGGGNAVGGSGGGAIQLVSNTRITIGGTGGINAGGCGAESAGGGNDGGGGGGAGGTILLEAPIISMAANAALAVNGGGGGGGDADNSGFVAEPGQLSRTAALGAPGKNDGNGGDGGNGAAGNVGTGGNGEVVLTKPAGGGGGAIGRIRLNTRDDTGLMINAAAVLSPHYDDGKTCTHGPATVQ